LEALKTRDQVESLLGGKRGLRRSNRTVVRELARNLPEDERLYLYDAHRSRAPFSAVFLNAAFYPLFLGSWQQGDRRGAAIGYLHSLVAGVGALAILNLSANYRFIELEVPGGGVQYVAFPQGNGWWGIVAIGASYAASMVQPLVFQRCHNRHLADALQVDPQSSKLGKARVSAAPPALQILPAAGGRLRVALQLVSLRY